MSFKSRIKKSVLPSLLIGASMAAMGSAHAQFSNVYVFGDSLSDTGNLGRFTNGDKRVWADLIASANGLTMTPAYSFATGRAVLGNGNGFAIGGAQANNNTVTLAPGLTTARPGATGQVTDLIQRSSGKLDPNALYMVWVGGNDINAQLGAVVAGGSPFAAGPAMQVAAQATLKAVSDLKAAGARRVLVMNLPNLGATPAVAQFGPSAQGLATSLSQTYNEALAAGLAGNSVAQFNVYPLFADMIANPTKYGLSNNNGKLCGTISAGACTLPSNGFLFADDLHPTTYTHSLIAQWVLGVFAAASDGAGLATVAMNAPLLRDGAALRAAQGRTRDFAERGAQGDRMYAIGNFAEVRVAGVNGSAETRGEATAWGVGYDTNLGTNTLAGASLASEHVPLDLVGGGRLRFEQRGLTVYVAHRYGAAYTSAHAAFGSLDYASQRDAHIGPVTATEHAEFAGRFKAAGLGAGYRFGDAKFTHGPFVSVDWRRVEINSFNEGNSATAIAVGSQKGERTSAEVGYRVGADSLFGKADTRPYAELAWRHDSNDDRELGIGTGSTGTVMPVSMPGESGSGGRISFGVNTKLTEKVEVGVGANFASGGPQGRDASLNIQFSAGF